MEQFFAYCDESGNTGHDLFAEGQPYYVLAAPVFAKPVAAFPAELLSDLDPSVAAQELKGSTLIRGGMTSTYVKVANWTTRGIAALCAAFIEKRYMAACKLLDAIMDPHDNEDADPGVYWNAEARGRLAEALYDLPTDVLKRSWDAYLGGDPPQFAHVLRELEERLPGLGLASGDAVALGRALTWARAHPAELVLSGNRPAGHRRDDAPNLAAFVALLQRLGRITRAPPGAEIHFVHDETGQFAPVIRTYHAMAGKPRPDFQLDFGNDQELVLPVVGIPTVRFEPSHRVAGLQVADIAAYSLQCFLSALHAPPESEPRRVAWEHGRVLASRAHTTGLLYGSWSARGRGFR